MLSLWAVGEDVPCHSYGDGYHESFEIDGVEDVGTEEEWGPQEAEGEDLRMEGDDLLLRKVADVCAQIGVMHEPVIHVAWAAVVAVGSKEYEWSSGQHRQKDTDDAHYETKCTEEAIEYFHFT